MRKHWTYDTEAGSWKCRKEYECGEELDGWDSCRSMRQAWYSEKLKDPRWRAKREIILKRDNWTCLRCGRTNMKWNVHHTEYFQGRDPWEYDNKYLQTLCEPCHKRDVPEDLFVGNEFCLPKSPKLTDTRRWSERYLKSGHTELDKLHGRIVGIMVSTSGFANRVVKVCRSHPRLIFNDVEALAQCMVVYEKEPLAILNYGVFIEPTQLLRDAFVTCRESKYCKEMEPEEALDNLKYLLNLISDIKKLVKVITD